MSPGGPAGSRSLIAVGTGRTAYLIPAAALRYLGKGLSPGLFEVPALRRAERDGRLPLRFGFAGRFPALPGLHGARIVRPAGRAVTGLATGYVAAVSAGRFWRALSRLLRAEGAGAFWVTLADGAGTAGVAAVVNGAVLAGGRSQRAPAHTLTVKGTNRFGQPDNGDTVTIDGVHQNKTVALLTFRHGIARVKVPAGRYWAIGDFMDFFDVHHPVPDMRLVTRPQFTVTRNTTIRFSERAATSKVTMSTPRPAVPADTTVEITRSGRYNYFEALDDGISIWVNPTRVAPSVGRLREYSSQQLVSPPGTRGVPYAYYLSFRGPEGIIPPQHFTIRPAGLATVHDRFFQGAPATAALERFSLFPAQVHETLLVDSLTFRVPRRQTEYLTANPAILWTDSLSLSKPASLGSVLGPMRGFRAGQHLEENWDAYPLSPQPDIRLPSQGGPALTQPSATRAGNLLRLAIAPLSDGQPGHTEPMFTNGRYALDRDGHQVAGGPLPPNPGPGGLNPLGFTAAASLGSKPSRLRLTLTASRPAQSYPLSPRDSVTWTWRSVPAPRAMLPGGWACRVSPQGHALAPGRHCAVQPMLMMNMTVARLRLNGSARAGRQEILLKAGRLPLAKAVPVTAATISISYDGGVTWHRARVARTGQTTFTATFTAPPGSYVTLRARAADADGGSVTETIQRGYRVTG